MWKVQGRTFILAALNTLIKCIIIIIIIIYVGIVFALG
jgi:hypothetical protein